MAVVSKSSPRVWLPGKVQEREAAERGFQSPLSSTRPPSKPPLGLLNWEAGSCACQSFAMGVCILVSVWRGKGRYRIPYTHTPNRARCSTEPRRHHRAGRDRPRREHCPEFPSSSRRGQVPTYQHQCPTSQLCLGHHHEQLIEWKRRRLRIPLESGKPFCPIFEVWRRHMSLERQTTSRPFSAGNLASQSDSICKRRALS